MRRAAWIALAFLVGCGPNLGALEKGEKGAVAQIVDGDTLVLESGLRVTLTEIEAPYGEAPFAQQARQGLEQLALQRPAQLAYGGERRYTPRRAAPAPAAAPAGPAADQAPTPPPAEPASETALAHVFVRSEGGRWIWLQGAMVEQGLAFVRPRKENHARMAELLAAEGRARAAERGLWGERAYRVRTPAQMVAEVDNLPSSCGQGPFRLVEGVVRSVADNDTRVYLNFGDDYRTDFTIAIYGDDAAAWRETGPAFETLRQRTIRARGRVGSRGGPLMCVDNPAQIEIVAQE